MTDDRLRVAVIIGSTRNGRFGPTVAGWFASRAHRRRDWTVDVIDLAETKLPETLGDRDESLPPSVTALSPRLAKADAFVVVTPEYNRSFPAPLKTAIDWFYEEWRAKPVAFVSYGRESGGRYATAQLREVFSELDAIPIRSTISLPCYWTGFTADGHWPKASIDNDASVAETIEQLTWWGLTLRAARDRHPYPS